MHQCITEIIHDESLIRSFFRTQISGVNITLKVTSYCSLRNCRLHCTFSLGFIRKLAPCQGYFNKNKLLHLTIYLWKCVNLRALQWLVLMCHFGWRICWVSTAVLTSRPAMLGLLSYQARTGIATTTRRLASLGIMVTHLRPHSLKPLQHYETMVSRGLREPFAERRESRGQLV